MEDTQHQQNKQTHEKNKDENRESGNETNEEIPTENSKIGWECWVCNKILGSKGQGWSGETHKVCT